MNMVWTGRGWLGLFHVASDGRRDTLVDTLYIYSLFTCVFTRLYIRPKNNISAHFCQQHAYIHIQTHTHIHTGILDIAAQHGHRGVRLCEYDSAQ